MRARLTAGLVTGAALLCSTLAAADVAHAPVVEPQTLHARIARHETRKSQIDAEVAGLGDRRAGAVERLETRTRALYRISRAGFAPMAGGFLSMLEHVSRVERMKRLVRSELSGLERLRTHGTALREEAIRIATSIAADKAALAAASQQAVVAEEESRMATLFDEAFAKPRTIANGTVHTQYGTIRIHGEDPAVHATRFESLRGQLTLPLSGAREVRDAVREDGMGLELLGTPGASVRAAAEGTVAFAANHPAYGLMVILDHGNRYFTVYGGLSDLGVREGDVVSASARLGHVGSALYVEVRRGTKSLDARAWLGV